MATKAPNTGLSKRAIMQDAWRRYRIERKGFSHFSKVTWKRCLCAAWREAKEETRCARLDALSSSRPVHQPSEMEQRIRDLSYLPFSVNIAAEEQRIRAEFGRAA